ncbi:hypothetical protein CKO28_13295 [Rhodovibrio sodomensis]|uniref:Conjugal transfer protein TraG n=1 Tax=Rhodovibrio sodomensis TaxID=1088 RepID=A0ABS1DGD9_9PROT|nr:type IV secretory system conjugative DNA transfer family protein [Rhodovibrio sodomensis]MBK1669007.1 hypothetical protein [Rhodovibrio sodomensis]
MFFYRVFNWIWARVWLGIVATTPFWLPAILVGTVHIWIGWIPVFGGWLEGLANWKLVGNLFGTPFVWLIALLISTTGLVGSFGLNTLAFLHVCFIFGWVRFELVNRIAPGLSEYGPWWVLLNADYAVWSSLLFLPVMLIVNFVCVRMDNGIMYDKVSAWWYRSMNGGRSFIQASTTGHGSSAFMSIKRAKAKFSQEHSLLSRFPNGKLPEPKAVIGCASPGASYDRKKREWVSTPKKNNQAQLLWKGTEGTAAHFLTVAGSGAGKTACVVIPNTLTWTGPLIVLDPKGEIYAASGKRRKQDFGQKIYRLKPKDSYSDAIDVFGWLDPSDPARFLPSVSQIAEALVPENSEGGDNKFFQKTASNLAYGIILCMLGEHYAGNPDYADPPTMNTFNRIASLTPERMMEMIEEWEGLLNESYREAENRFLELQGTDDEPEDKDEFLQYARYPGFTVSAITALGKIPREIEKTFPNAVSTLTSELGWMDDWKTSKIVRKPGRNGRYFNPLQVFDGDVTLYIQIPVATLTNKKNAGLPRLILTCLMQPILQEHNEDSVEGGDSENGDTQGVAEADGENENAGGGPRKLSKRLLFLIDEMPALGSMPILHETANNIGRGAGITLWGIVQDIGQVKDSAGDSGKRNWLNNATVQWFGVTGETAKEASEMLGQTTVVEQTEQGEARKGSASKPFSDWGSKGSSYRNMARSLLTPDELSQMPPGQVLVMAKQEQPVLCGLPFYKGHVELKAMMNRAEAQSQTAAPEGADKPAGEGDGAKPTAHSAESASAPERRVPKVGKRGVDVRRVEEAIDAGDGEKDPHGLSEEARSGIEGLKRVEEDTGRLKAASYDFRKFKKKKEEDESRTV